MAEIRPRGRELNKTHQSGMLQFTSNFSISLNSSLKLQFFCLLPLVLDIWTALTCFKGQTCRVVKARTRQGGSQASGPFLCPDHGLRCGWGLDAPKTLAMNWARAVPVKSLGDKERGGGDASWEPVQPAPADRPWNCSRLFRTLPYLVHIKPMPCTCHSPRKRGCVLFVRLCPDVASSLSPQAVPLPGLACVHISQDSPWAPSEGLPLTIHNSRLWLPPTPPP